MGLSYVTEVTTSAILPGGKVSNLPFEEGENS
jgi:hypothetical protein